MCSIALLVALNVNLTSIRMINAMQSFQYVLIVVSATTLIVMIALMKMTLRNYTVLTVLNQLNLRTTVKVMLLQIECVMSTET